MKKSFILLVIVLLFGSCAIAAATKPFGYDLEADINRNNPKYNKNATTKLNDNNKQVENSGPTFYSSEDTKAEWESERNYYPKATLSTAIRKYKSANYSGALQEFISLSKRDSSNPLIYYYLGMCYAQVGNKDQAVLAYEKVIKLNSDKSLVKYATKGRDCLVGGPTCSTESETEEDKELDAFVKSPYGNGFSEQLNQEIKVKQLKNIQNNINKKQDLPRSDIDDIRDFDRRGDIETTDKVAKEVTNEEILSAIETLKNAGITISVNPYQQPIMPNNEYAQLGMLFNNGNNSGSSMMNMLPYMMAQYNNGQNLDPQMFQSMMMNSMIPDFTFNDKKDY